MKHRLLTALTTTMLIASLAATPLSLAATKATPAMAAVATACTGVAAEAGARRGCVSELQKSLRADPASIKALQAAGAAGNQSAAKDVLQKLGLTEAELAGAKIVIDDQSGGAAKIKSVTINITCCPLTITIIIRL